MTLGARLKKARDKRGWNQQYVSKATKISNTALSNYERDYREPDQETLKTLADLYGVSIDWLMARTDDPYMNDNSTFRDNADILRQIVNKYDIDLTIPGNRDKLEKIIELVVSDQPKKV